MLWSEMRGEKFYATKETKPFIFSYKFSFHIKLGPNFGDGDGPQRMFMNEWYMNISFVLYKEK